jgi:diguanylate cyclase (GGDEF)-like protein/PAS domain S-box-containing protein
MSGERILIVEDEKIIAFDLQRRLRSFGFEVVGQCTNGADALSLVEVENPDLVLMDIRLEGTLDGIDTSRLILEKFQIPSIFLTAYSDEATLERAKTAQPLGFLIKPFKERELLSTLDMALYKARLDAKFRDQERWIAAILDSVADAVVAFDLEERVHFVNPAACEIIGQSADRILGKPAKEVFTLLDEESMIPLRYAGPDEPRESFQVFHDVLLQTPEGQVLPVEGRIAQVRFDKLAVGRVVTFRDVSRVRKLNERIEQQAKYDSLTGLLNRKEFTSQLARTWENKVKQNVPCTMLYLDLDQFKLINDTCGHLAGDELLRQTAEILRRLKDTQTVAMARLGGDEFAVLFENCGTDVALEKAWVVKHQLNGHEFVWQATNFRLKASIGLITLSPEYDDSRHILAAADDACYLAKEEGGNRIKVYDLQDATFRQRRGEMTLISRLGQALEESRFVLYEQEIRPIDPGAGLRPKVEVLIRLKEIDGSLIFPDEFIPAAERYNLMPQIDRWVIRTALSHYAALQGSEKPVYCINLSGESIADTNLVSYIKHEFKKNNLDPRDFCFEITETATIANLANAEAFLQDLKSVGCSFALDDFGRGFSSFAYLKNLPVDYLKIDGAFIESIDKDPVNLAMVTAMKDISKSLGLLTIAEFVSSEAILETVTRIGIDFAQGYTIGKPEPLR